MNSVKDIWAAVIDVLSQNLTSTAISTWFSDCSPVDISSDELIIYTPSDFKREIIVNRFSETIKGALSDIFSMDFGLTVLAGDELIDYQAKSSKNSDLPEMAGYTFDRFIVGESNKFAHAAAVAVSKNPGGAYNPLFIYGNSGLGKTHLLLAIGQAIREKDPSAKIEYIKGDEFTNQLVAAIKKGTGEEFRMKYRNVDLFLVDDIQFIAGKQATQDEFFHTFNNIYEAGHQIVITSDRPPLEMSLLEDRLRTRFEGGLMADIQPYDLETRMIITRTKAAQLGLVLKDETVEYIAEMLTANVRQIEGVIKRLTAYKNLININSEIDVEAAKRAIGDVTRLGTYIPSPDHIINETARYFSLKPEELRGQNRSKLTASARHIAIYLCRTLTSLSLQEIGAEFDDRNHSTVLNSITRIEDALKTDPSMATTIRDITANINSV